MGAFIHSSFWDMCTNSKQIKKIEKSRKAWKIINIFDLLFPRDLQHSLMGCLGLPVLHTSLPISWGPALSYFFFQDLKPLFPPSEYAANPDNARLASYFFSTSSPSLLHTFTLEMYPSLKDKAASNTPSLSAPIPTNVLLGSLAHITMGSPDAWGTHLGFAIFLSGTFVAVLPLSWLWKWVLFPSLVFWENESASCGHM